MIPDHLFPWMMRSGIWPELETGSLEKYWQHLNDSGSPLASMSDGTHIPVYLWGDGAQYTESGESMLVFSCGIVIDDNRSNIFPLFMCREVSLKFISCEILMVFYCPPFQKATHIQRV